MFAEAWFQIARNQRLHKYPTTGEWLNRGIFVQWDTSRQNKNEHLIHSSAWISLKIVVSEKKPNNKYA